MVSLWAHRGKCLVAGSCRVDFAVVTAAVFAPEKIHYVNFVGMMTRNDLVGNSKSFDFLQKEKKIKTLWEIQSWIMNVRETQKKCKRMVQKSGHMYMQPWCNIDCLACSASTEIYFNYCESIKTKARNSAAEKKWNETVMRMRIYGHFTFLYDLNFVYEKFAKYFRVHTHDVYIVKLSDCPLWENLRQFFFKKNSRSF